MNGWSFRIESPDEVEMIDGFQRLLTFENYQFVGIYDFFELFKQNIVHFIQVNPSDDCTKLEGYRQLCYCL